MNDDVDIWRYETVAGERVEVHRKRGKGTKPWRTPGGVEGPYFPLDYDVLDTCSPVVVTEGERDRDAVIANTDFPATCWSGGAGNWDKTDWNVLAGCEVILWPDRDGVGYDAMEALAYHLFDLDCTIKSVDPPLGPADGWGAADASPEQARSLVADAYDVPNPWTDGLEAGSLINEAEFYPEWQAIPGMMQCGAVTIWHGPPKGGKSAFALLAGSQLLTGHALTGIQSQDAPRSEDQRDHKLLMIWLEESRMTTHGRRLALCEHHELSTDIWDESDWLFNLKAAKLPDKIKAIKYCAKHTKPTVVFIDNLARFDPMAEKTPEQATATIMALESIAREMNCAIVLIHHSRKQPGSSDGGTSSGDEMLRGSSALTGAARVIMEIRPDGRDHVEIIGGGTNNAASVGNLRFKKHSVRVNSFPVVALAADKPPELFEGIPTERAKQMHAHLLQLDSEQRQHEVRSTDWAGHALAEWLELDTGQGKLIRECTNDEIATRKRMSGILGQWSKNGLLAVTIEQIKRGNRATVKRKIYCKGKKGWTK